MNNEFIKANYLVSDLNYKLKAIFDDLDENYHTNINSLEDERAYDKLEYLIDAIDDFERDIKYLSSDDKEGFLKLHYSNKFYIVYDDNTESELLSCGHSLEILVDDEWHIGRVEYSWEINNKGYYYYGLDNPLLYEGMRVRKRVF